MIRATLRRAVLAFFVLPAIWNPLHAQFATPVIDGVIEPGEYGNTTNGTNQIATNTAQTWYMTWDATNLYVGITNANLSEAAVIYIDANPLNPPAGGTNANGSLAGFNYDGTDFASLPFRAQFVTYFKDGYNEYRNSNGSGGWGDSNLQLRRLRLERQRQCPRIRHSVERHHGRRYPRILPLLRLSDLQRRVCLWTGSQRQWRRCHRNLGDLHPILRGKRHCERRQYPALLRRRLQQFGQLHRALSQYVSFLLS